MNPGSLTTYTVKVLAKNAIGTRLIRASKPLLPLLPQVN